MNKITVIIFTGIVLFCLVSCEKKTEENLDISSMKLYASKTSILNNNDDAVTITVRDQDGNNVTSYVDIYAGSEPLSSSEFRSLTAGHVDLYAKYNNIVSDTTTVKVVEDAGLKYYKNILVEQFTGTWCGYCPRAIYQIASLQLVDTGVVHIAYHLNDEFSFSYNNTLFQAFGFTGVPTVYLDRQLTWLGGTSSVSSLHKAQRVGLELSVSGSQDELLINARVKFGIIYDKRVALSVFVVHDSLVADQRNYYNDDPSSPWYGAGETMTGFVHNSIIVKNATNIFGDFIPTEDIDIGAEISKDYSVTDFTCNDINKIRVIAFVHYTAADDYVVLNALSCDFGASSNSTLVSK